jgi:hypothetical protein
MLLLLRRCHRASRWICMLGEVGWTVMAVTTRPLGVAVVVVVALVALAATASTRADEITKPWNSSAALKREGCE